MVDFTDPRTMSLLGFGSALLQQSGASPREITMGEGVGGGFQGALQGAQAAYGFQGQEMLRKKMQDEALQRIEAQEFLKNHQLQGTDPRTLASQALMSGNPQLISMAGQFMKTLPKVKTTEKVMKDGQAFTRPVFDDGTFGSVSDMPVAEKLMQINQGSQIGLANPFSGDIQKAVGVGMAPGEQARLAQSAQHHDDSMGMQRQNLGLAQQNAQFNRQKELMMLDPEFLATRARMAAAGKEQGMNQAKAITDLPRTVQQGEQTIKLVDDLLAHPGFGISVGKTAPAGSLAAMVPGTNAASFDIALTQLKGKQFLEAFESLKGGGAITEIEGQKAQQAMSRMEKSNTEEEFTKASREFQSIIKQGIDRAKAKASGQQQSLEQQPFNSGGFSVRRLD